MVEDRDDGRHRVLLHESLGRLHGAKEGNHSRSSSTTLDDITSLQAHVQRGGESSSGSREGGDDQRLGQHGDGADWERGQDEWYY